MRKIAVVTVARSDFNIYLPLLHKIQEHPSLELQLIVSGMHLDPAFGMTKNEIVEAGFSPAAEVETPRASDTPLAISQVMGAATSGYASAYDSLEPDIITVLGDRYEMHPAAVAALPFRIPVAHIHGGELTFGAIDDSLRHSITKLSHVHFASTEEYAKRIVQMGEDPTHVHHTGGLAVDNMLRSERMGLEEFNETFFNDKNSLSPGFLLTTFHPVTLEYEDTKTHIDNLLTALKSTGREILFTLPNADTSGNIIIEKIRSYVEQNDNACMVDNLGNKGYYSAMELAGSMIGNSSSGLLESAPFKIPVVNIGTRQAGRVRPDNVIDVGYSAEEISSGIQQAFSPDFQSSLADLQNPYGDGGAAEKMVKILSEIPLDQQLIVKKFRDQAT